MDKRATLVSLFSPARTLHPQHLWRRMGTIGDDWGRFTIRYPPRPFFSTRGSSPTRPGVYAASRERDDVRRTSPEGPSLSVSESDAIFPFPKNY